MPCMWSYGSSAWQLDRQAARYLYGKAGFIVPEWKGISGRTYLSRSHCSLAVLEARQKMPMHAHFGHETGAEIRKRWAGAGACR